MFRGAEILISRNSDAVGFVRIDVSVFREAAVLLFRDVGSSSFRYS